MEDAQQQNRMWDLAEAATYLGYHPSGLRKIVNRTKQGKPGPQIQFHQAGKNGRIKFKCEWLDEFILANSIEPGQVRPAMKAKRVRRNTEGRRVPIEPIWATAS